MGPLTSKEKKKGFIFSAYYVLRHLWWTSWKEQIVERGGRGYIEHVATLLIGSQDNLGAEKLTVHRIYRCPTPTPTPTPENDIWYVKMHRPKWAPVCQTSQWIG